jgi:cholest-4-en-3-one 26-monooxygenase
MTGLPRHDAPLPLHDARLYAAGFPYERFRWLRDHDPVSHHEHEAYEGGYWVVARHADVRTVSRRTEVWRNAPGPMVETPPGSPPEPGTDMLINLDGHEHAQMRTIVSRGFTPRRVAMLEDRLRVRVDAILDALHGRTGADLVRDVAQWLPLHVIADLVGVPEADREQLFTWTETLFGFDAAVTDDDRLRTATTMFAYAEALGRQRQKAPRDDLLSLLVHAEVDGHRLTDLQVSTFFMLLQNAGSETTRSVIAGGTVALLNHPDQFARLRADPSLLPLAVEELARYVTPVMYFCRQAARDTDLDGVTIRKGERVLMSYVSANRDERVFGAPDTLDVTRTPNDHVAFGAGGPHFCLGASLARLELKIMFEAITTRFQGLAVDGDPAALPRLHSNFIDGLATAPVTWTAITPKVPSLPRRMPREP